MAKRAPAKATPAAVTPQVAYARTRNCPVAFILVDEIEGPLPIRLERELRGKRFQKLELVLHSPGGNPHSAYQAMRIARMHAKSVVVSVPYLAKSAATLMCLGADEIFLGEVAELGPLDTQVRERKSAGKFRQSSALNPSKAIDQLRRVSMVSFELAVRSLLTGSDLDHQEAAELAVKFVSATTGQLFSRLDPLQIGEYSRALEIGREYGSRLMSRSGVIPAENRPQVLNKLVEGYPSHDFIIEFEELQSLGFKVSPLGDASISAFPAVLRDVIGDEGMDHVEVVEP